MKGMVFLLYGLPPSWPELGPRAWEGGVERTWDCPYSVGHGTQAQDHLFMSPGTYTSLLCEYNSGRLEDVLFT